MFSAEYKIIKRSDDGKYYLDDETVVLLANYIAKLEDLNNNYKLQIANLEEQVKNLRDLLELEKTENATLKQKNETLAKEIERFKVSANVWTIIASIAIGSTIVLLFFK